LFYSAFPFSSRVATTQGSSVARSGANKRVKR